MKKTDVSPRLYAYLEEWHKTSTGNQRSKGVDVDLPFEDFLNLFTKRQLNSLQNAIDTNRLRYQQDKTNKFAFVLSWVSYSARSSNKMTKDTACICSRMKSARINLPQSGDVLREDHKQAISASLTDKEKTVEHKQAISQATKGVSKAPWSEQRKRERRELIAEKKAAKLDATRRAEEDAWARVQSLQRSEPPENA